LPAAADKVTVWPASLMAPEDPKEILLLEVVAFNATAEVKTLLKAIGPLSVKVSVPPVTLDGLAVPTTVMPPVMALDPMVKPPVEVIVANSV